MVLRAHPSFRAYGHTHLHKSVLSYLLLYRHRSLINTAVFTGVVTVRLQHLGQQVHERRPAARLPRAHLASHTPHNINTRTHRPVTLPST